MKAAEEQRQQKEEEEKRKAAVKKREEKRQEREVRFVHGFWAFNNTRLNTGSGNTDRRAAGLYSCDPYKI